MIITIMGSPDRANPRPPAVLEMGNITGAQADLAAMIQERGKHPGPNKVHPRYLESKIFGRFLNLKYYGYIVDKQGRNEELDLEPGLYAFASAPPREKIITDAKLRELIDNQEVSRLVGHLEVTVPDTGKRKGKALKQAYRRAFQQAERIIRGKNTQDHDGRLMMWDKNGNEVKDRAAFGAVHE